MKCFYPLLLLQFNNFVVSLLALLSSEEVSSKNMNLMISLMNRLG